jgi:hypothetical protein
MIRAWWIGKDFERSGCVLAEVISFHLPGELRKPGAPAKIPTEHLQDKNVNGYRYASRRGDTESW